MKSPLVSFVVAGILGAGVTGCGSSTSSENNAVSERINSFKADCEEKGGIAKVVDTCAGNNGCAGLNPDGTEHDCQGTASCDGAVWCEEVK